MDYQQAMAYLANSYGAQYKHNLDFFSGFMASLGHPERRLNIIHVAGTNGKGSTCAMLRHVLTEAGYCTGLFTSPHLVKVNERFTIDGQMIADSELAGYISMVKDAAEAYGSGASLAFFEIMTAIAFCYFADHHVDFAIIEVGMGGRLDATNIIEKPVLSVITAIGLDHTAFLGRTISAITREKCGIIKKNCPVVLYSQAKKVYNIVDEISSIQEAPLHYVDQPEILMLREDLEGSLFSVATPLFAYEGLRISLLGRHQVDNACTVLLAVHALNACGAAIDEAAVRAGLSKALWPGRMELVSRAPLILLDGAHNPAGISALTTALDAYFAGKPITLIAGMMRDKDCGPMMRRLAESARQMILTKPSGHNRAMEPEELYHMMQDSNKKIILEPDDGRALAIARQMAGPDGVICCAGSLYLIGNMRKIILETGDVIDD